MLSFLWAYSSVAGAQIDALKDESSRINKEIQDAEAKDAALAGGLVKALIQARIELLKTNAELVRQRIHAAESGTKIKIRIEGIHPNPKRAAELKEEMESVDKEIADKEAESAQYRGGLVKAMIESSIATMYNTRAMLQAEYLKAKYGIYWLPSLKEEKTAEARKAGARQPEPSSAEKGGEAKKAEAELLIPTLINKRFQASDFRQGIYEDAIWFDISWDTSNLKKPTRAVKGILIIGDIFGEPKLRLRWTINEALRPSQEYTETGVGFEYNQFNREQKWARVTELKDMTFRFEVTDVIYQNGSRENY